MAQRGLRTEATFEAKQLGAGAPGTVPQIVESRIVPRQRGDTIPCASCWKGFLPPTSPRSGNAIFRTGLFVGDVGWSIAASNTLLSKVSNAAHGSGRSNWTKGPLNPAPPKRGLLQ